MILKEPVTAAGRTYVAEFEPAEEGGYLVRFPSIQGLVTEGETLDEARFMAADALRCLIEGHEEDDLPIPPSEADPEPVTRKLRTA
jgi:antitoxin HicB